MKKSPEFRTGDFLLNRFEMLYTLSQLRDRHSVRNFTRQPLDSEAVKKLNAEITMINTHEAGIYFHLVENDPEPFSRFTSSYGFFVNAANYITCVVDEDFDNCRERAGYFAEQLVMQAQALGLSTCFVGGTLDAKKVNAQLRAGRKLLFIILVGYKSMSKGSLTSRIAGKILHRNRRSPESFFEGDIEKAEKEFPSLGTMLAALASAPSSYNGQPVRIRIIEKDGQRYLGAGVDESNPKNLIDLGIAKFNMAAVGDGEWEWGNYAPYYI